MVQEPKQQPSKRQPKKAMQTWAILHVGDKLRWLGDVVASDAEAAIALGTQKFGRDAKELMAERRRWTT
jgi:hypothetical protein